MNNCNINMVHGTYGSQLATAAGLHFTQARGVRPVPRCARRTKSARALKPPVVPMGTVLVAPCTDPIVLIFFVKAINNYYTHIEFNKSIFIHPVHYNEC